MTSDVQLSLSEELAGGFNSMFSIRRQWFTCCVSKHRHEHRGRHVQSGASSLAKHGGAYFSAVYGSIEDPVAAPGPCKPQVC